MNAARVIAKFLKDLFSSIRFGIVLLLIIAVIAIVGTVVEQGKLPQYYDKLYGAEAAEWILKLSINKIYGSLWMVVPTVLLVINLIYATLLKIPSIVRSTAVPKKFHINPKFSESVSVGNRYDAIIQSSGILKSHHYKIYKLADGSLFAHKGVLSRFGMVVVHLSILIILLGGLIGALYSYKNFVNFVTIDAGYSKKIPEINTVMKLDRFWIDYWPDGSYKQYNTMISFIKNGKVVYKQLLNHDNKLDYGGFRFFHEYHEKSYDRVKSVVLLLYDKRTQKVVGNSITAEWNRWTKIGPYSVKVVDFVPDFYFDKVSGRITTKSIEYNNPAVRIQVKGAPNSFDWEFIKYPGDSINEFKGDMAVVAYSINPIYFVNFRYAYNPGANLIWFGSIIMIIGFMLSFYLYYRRIHIDVDSDAERLILSGNSYKHKDSFTREFERISKEIKDCLREET
ncbi:MAG: cytochrome c biogenesis protein ResB [Epsilonproteobacteria bacterium]|nr:cytochrome c biogenesis protein ResB [Campylobacterota bacterium]